MREFDLVFTAEYQAQLKALSNRYQGMGRVQAAVEFGLRRDPYVQGVDSDGYGVVFTQPFNDVPALRIAYRVTIAVNLLAIDADV